MHTRGKCLSIYLEDLVGFQTVHNDRLRKLITAQPSAQPHKSWPLTLDQPNPRPNLSLLPKMLSVKAIDYTVKRKFGSL